MTKLGLLVAVVFLVVLVVALASCHRDDAPGEGVAEEPYVRQEDDSMLAFYDPYAEFTPETPESTAAFVTRVEALTGLPRHAPQVVLDDPSIVYESGWDVHPDGERFLLMQRPGGTVDVDQIHIVSNWLSELERLVPTER